MKALIPAAGRGTRLYPHTYTKPKAMVRIAGRPILGHIIAGFRLTPVTEINVVIGGPMQDQIREYADSTFGDEFDLSFVEQERPEGLGHSVYQAKSEINGEAIIIALGDMLFEESYQRYIESHSHKDDVDGSIGTKAVDEPQRYGVVELEDGRIDRLVEKPSDPRSNLAISGVYVIENSPKLFDALEYIIKNNRRGAGGEFQLTDALDRMIRDGAVLGTFDVDDWYDCGRPETLLDANRVTLDRMPTNGVGDSDTTVVIEPVDFGENVKVQGSVIGPYVSVDDGAMIENSIVRDSIIGRKSILQDVNLVGSIIGDLSEVGGDTNRLNVGDNSSISF